MEIKRQDELLVHAMQANLVLTAKLKKLECALSSIKYITSEDMLHLHASGFIINDVNNIAVEALGENQAIIINNNEPI